MAYETGRLNQWLAQSRSAYSSIAAKMDSLLEQRERLRREIAELSDRIRSVEMEMSNLQAEINSVYVPYYDSDDPDGSMAAAEQARARIAALQSQLSALSEQASKFRQELEKKRGDLSGVEKELRQLGAACEKREHALLELQRAYQYNAQQSQEAAQKTAQIAGMRFGSTTAGAASRAASLRSGEAYRGASESGSLAVAFRQLAAKI